jgi:hypothetical protein
MLHYTTTDLSTNLTTMKQRLSRPVKNARFLAGSCHCLNDTYTKILFRINWWWVNQLFHVAFLHGFSVATTAMFGQKQTLMLHLFTATKVALQSTFEQALCMTFWVSLLCSPMAHCTDLLGISGGNSTRSAGGNSLGTQEKRGSRTTGLQVILHIRSENNSLPLIVIAGLNEADMWLGLPGHRTAHRWTSSCGAAWKSWFTHCQLIWKRIVLAV